jgi:hypothetical protein
VVALQVVPEEDHEYDEGERPDRHPDNDDRNLVMVDRFVGRAVVAHPTSLMTGEPTEPVPGH